MRKIVFFVIVYYISLDLFAYNNAIDSIVNVIKNDIAKEQYRKAWRDLHNNRVEILNNDEVVYTILLTDIYQGSYLYLQDDKLRKENKEALENLSKVIFSNRLNLIEKEHGSMWQRLFWLCRIYHEEKELNFDLFIDDCKKAFEKSLYKEDPYFRTILYTYVNYLITNGKDWSYTIIGIPFFAIKVTDSNSDIELAIAYHQKGIAYLQKEIQNRIYEFYINNGAPSKKYTDILIRLAKENLDIAQLLYNKCDLKESEYQRDKLKLNLQLYKWLVDNPNSIEFNLNDSIFKPVCFYNILPLDIYKPISKQLDSISVENSKMLELSLHYLKEKEYKAAADCLLDVAPSLINPLELVTHYYSLIYSLSMYDPDKATQYLENFYNLSQLYILPYIYRHYTEYEIQKIWKSLSIALLQIGMKNAIQNPNSFSSICAYNIIQTLKNFDIEVSKSIRQYKNSKDIDQVSKRAIEYYNKKKNAIYHENFADPFFDAEIELLELNKMILNSKIPINDIFNNIYTYERIAKKLSSKASLVEYCNYIDIDGKSRYAAFIINTEQNSPIIIDICSTEEADRLIYQNEDSINASYSNELIYRTIFSNIEPYLQHDTVIVCPVGILEAINFEAIYHKGKRLMDKYLLIRSYSGHSFFKSMNTPHSSKGDAVLFGGITYDNGQLKEAEYADKHFKLSKGKRYERGSLQYLQYSAEEVATIRDIMNDGDYKATIYSGDKATEIQFFALDGNAPSFLHIATHGFFLSDDKDLKEHPYFNNIELYDDYKLQRSGLFLANSNKQWKNQSPSTTHKDGILTACEISQLDLSNVILSVLSSCNTAKGFVDNIKGTQGLQYAFRLAGAGAMILSLWEIDDAVTYMFMKEFYTVLFTKEKIDIAYHSAINKVRKEYPDPYYWAGFIYIQN